MYNRRFSVICTGKFLLILIALYVICLNTVFYKKSDERNKLIGNSEDKPKYNFIVIIKSPSERAENRNFLRNSSWLAYNWKNDAGNNISWTHFFLVGFNPSLSMSKVLNESEKHKDILIAPTMDEYLMQIYKLMWAQRYLLDNYFFNFLVILDEDALLNVNGANSYLSKLLAEENDSMFYGGSACEQRPVYRNGKWKMSRDIWPAEHYPIYCDGSGLIYSSQTVRELLRVWDENRQPVLGIDDAMIGVLVALSGNISITTVTNATQGCKGGRSDTFLVQQIQPLEKGAEIMKNYNATGIYCEEDVPSHYLS